MVADDEQKQRRIFRLLCASVGMLMAAHLVVSTGQFLSAHDTKTVGRILTFAMAGVAALFAARAAVRRHNNLRLSWSLLTVGCSFWLVASLVSVVFGTPNISFFGFMPLSLFAVGSAGVKTIGFQGRARALLDGLTIGVVLAFATWTWMIEPNRESIPDDLAGRLWGTGHIGGDLAVATIAFSAFMSSRGNRRLPTPTVVLLVIGYLSYTVADSAGLAGGFSGHSFSWAWTVGFAFITLATGWYGPSPEKREPSRHVPITQVLPSVAAAVALAGVLDGVNHGARTDFVSEWLGSCLVVCVLIRQLVAVLEEQRLKGLLQVGIEVRTEQLSRRERQFEALVEHSSDVIVILGEDWTFEYVSPSIKYVLGHTAEELTDEVIADIIVEGDRARVGALLEMARRREGASMTAEWRVMREDGVQRHVEVLIRNLMNEPAVGGIVLNIRDVTERKELEAQLSHQALHDELTGLANRGLLRTRIEEALTRWMFEEEAFTLVVVDLDDFKAINDSLGHVVGDAVLKTLAERLGTCTRSGDTIVRLNGDEFAVLLNGVAAGDEEAVFVAERIIAAVQQPMRVEGRTLALRGSVGIACVTDQVTEAADILRNADLALHSAKLTKRGGYVRFESEMHDSALRRVELEGDLRRAIDNDELLLHYQPTIDIATGRIDGVEALLRWPHPEKGYISPVDFIPLAEESGLIVPMGTWVLKQACNEMRKWQARYPMNPPLTLNVNLSGRQLDEPDVVNVVKEILANSGLAPGTLVLEMTESVLMDDNPKTLAKMQALVDVGVKLAIDDFGTGYSSLSYLRHFPIGILKIDRSFVTGLGADGTEGETALVQAIVDLARTLQMKTVAEGIETQEQLAELARMGCDVGQGFLLARPAPAEDVRRLIEKTVAAGLPVEAMT